jgi:hypothetical protein
MLQIAMAADAGNSYLHRKEMPNCWAARAGISDS